MTDARALLRAKRQEARITHPHASYTSAGQLRCMVCGVPVKSTGMWEGHVSSKVHRVAVAALRQRQQQQEEDERRRLSEAQEEDQEKREEDREEDVEEEERRRLGKRKADKEESRMEVDGEEMHAKKRMRSLEPHPPARTKSRSKGAGGGFPADFFSDPSHAPVLSADDGEDEEDDDDVEVKERTPVRPSAPSEPPAPPAPKSQIELEWERFQAALQIPATGDAELPKEEERREAFERATVFAEAQMVDIDAAGFPPGVSGAGAQAAAEPPEPEKQEETEEERRRRKEQEERELIMDRLIEEERAQEEADERVSLLKARVEALKRMREAKRANKSATPAR